MARGLDELEGEVIEAIGIFLLIVLAVFAFVAWKGFSGFDLQKMLADVIRKLANGLDSFFANALNKLTPAGAPSGGFGSAEVKTGSSNMGDGGYYGSEFGDQVDYSSPAISGNELDQYSSSSYDDSGS